MEHPGLPDAHEEPLAFAIHHIGCLRCREELLRRQGLRVLEDGGVPVPRFTFSRHACGLPSWLRPTTVTARQAAAWPLLRSGRDLVAIADHGCGRTMAYAVPLVLRAPGHEQPDYWRHRAWQEWRQRPPQGLILVTTRERSAQAAGFGHWFSFVFINFHWFFSCFFIGFISFPVLPERFRKRSKRRSQRWPPRDECRWREAITS